MCGRYTLRTPPQALAKLFELVRAVSQRLRYNIAPTQEIAAVRTIPGGTGRELVLLRWGLVPAWAKDLGQSARMINARAETAATKPAFRAAFRNRRCLVPADGFYEWQRRGGHKQPFYFCLRDGGPFAFAGLWEHWEGPDGEIVESASLLTTDANEVVRPVHERMPVIVRAEDYGRWLDPEQRNSEALQPLLRPYASEEMTSYAVSTWVNNPRNDDAGCAQPLAETSTS